MNINFNQIIAYLMAMILLSIGGYISTQVKKMREDKNSFYNKQTNYLEQKMGQANYDKGKQIVVDAVYKAEQLGKEMAWDGLTKHSKVTEWVAGKTNLPEEDVFDIIKTTVGYINAKKTSTAIVTPAQ